VHLVEEAHGQQQQSRSEVQPRPVQVVERRELDRDRAILAGARVLELDLGVEHEGVRELVPDVEHGPGEVGDVLAVARRIRAPVAVDPLGVASQGEPLADAVNLRGGRSKSVCALQSPLLRDPHLGPEPPDLVHDHRELSLQLLDLVRLPELAVRQRLRGEGPRGEQHQSCESRSGAPQSPIPDPDHPSRLPPRLASQLSGLEGSGPRGPLASASRGGRVSHPSQGTSRIRLQRRHLSSTPRGVTRATRLPQRHRQSVESPVGEAVLRSGCDMRARRRERAIPL
jgi:hypothetical protein